MTAESRAECTNLRDEVFVIGELRAAVHAAVRAPRVRRPGVRRGLGARQVVLERLRRALARRARCRRAVAVRVPVACIARVVVVLVLVLVVVVLVLVLVVVVLILVLVDAIVVRNRSARVPEQVAGTSLSVAVADARGPLLRDENLRLLGHVLLLLLLLHGTQEREETAQLCEWTPPKGQALRVVRVPVLRVGLGVDFDRLGAENLLRLKERLEFGRYGRLLWKLVLWRWSWSRKGLRRERVVLDRVGNGERRGRIDHEKRLLGERVGLELANRKGNRHWFEKWRTVARDGRRCSEQRERLGAHCKLIRKL